MKLHTFYVSIFALALTSLSRATVSFDLQAEQLRTSAGNAAPITTLAFLVADTSSNGFGSVVLNSSTTVGSSLNSGSDDKILAKFDLSAVTTPGVLLSTPSGITIPQGTPLALYWFPTLDSSSPTIPSGSTYGVYTNSVAVDDSNIWVAPANGVSNYKLYDFTSSATVLHTGGTNSAASGNASLTVAAAPEPSRMVLMSLGLGAFFLRRRRMA